MSAAVRESDKLLAYLFVHSLFTFNQTVVRVWVPGGVESAVGLCDERRCESECECECEWRSE